MLDTIQRELLPPYDFGVTAAQFNAIRAQNNEEFAASGFVHFGKHRAAGGSGGTPVNQGLWTLWSDASGVNNIRLGIADGVSSKAGDSKTDYPVLNITGVLFHISSINLAAEKQNNIKFPDAPDGRTTYNKSTGAVTTYDHPYQAFAAAEADPTNIEVVTDRVDMWGFEAWLEEVTYNNPFVYPNGLIQSQATTMNGVSTAASNRAVSYYAVFGGDTSSKGKGVNFFTQTAENRKKILADPKNNLFFDVDGKLYQWRLRQRTFVGAGNGDWAYIDPVGGYTLQSTTNANSRIEVQGEKDLPQSNVGSQFFSPKNNNLNSDPQLGVFTSRWKNTIDSPVYFLVCGTVSRLNQGAYHPSFNPPGASMFVDQNSGYGEKWYEPATGAVNSTAICFADGAIGTPGKSSNSGKISSGNSGRPDGRFYDAIYADGQGGVCRDMRYSAYGITSVAFAEADLRVKNGTYRGFEKRVFSIPEATPAQTSSSGAGLTISEAQYDYIKAGSKIHVQDMPSSLGTYSTYTVSNVLGNPGDRYITAIGNFKNRVSGTEPIIISEIELTQSVGGLFLQTDVIGDPANIIQIDALKNGWEGSWIPVIPDGTAAFLFDLTRKSLSTTASAFFSSNNGASWGNTNATIDTVRNGIVSTTPVGNIVIWQYQAFAKQTEPSTNIVVYGGKTLLNDVIYSSSYRGELFGLLWESTLGIITTNSLYLAPNKFGGEVNLVDTYMDTADKLSPVYYPEHSPLKLGAANNKSPAGKVLPYNVVISNQAFKQYAATELKHDGTDWGDDNKIHIVDGESTMTDLNGNTVKVVTHKLKEPIGWIKNKV